MEKYRVAYKIDKKLKFRSINAKNEKTLNRGIKRRYSSVKGFSIIYYEKVYDFKYGLFDDISKHFMKLISGNTPQEVIRNSFKILGNNARKERYIIKPFNLTKDEQTIYNKKIESIDKYVKEVLQKDE